MMALPTFRKDAPAAVQQWESERPQRREQMIDLLLVELGEDPEIYKQAASSEMLARLGRVLYERGITQELLGTWLDVCDPAGRRPATDPRQCFRSKVDRHLLEPRSPEVTMVLSGAAGFAVMAALGLMTRRRR